MEKYVWCLFVVAVVLLVRSPAPVFSFTSTKVNLHEAATLPCYQRCSGLVTWATPDKQHDILAQCDQTSCQSEEGFQMSHDEYLKGNLSLTIIEADFNKRNWYTCKCDGEGICDVSLRLEPFNYPLSVRVGESLTLDLPIPDDVEVTIKTNGSNPFRLCTVEGRKAQCESKYEKRVSVSSSLRLKEVKNDDGGIYTIRDIKNDEVIGTYAVTVNVPPPENIHTFNSTKVNLFEAATLPCYQRCSGLVTWATPDKEHDILAQCDQTSCQSEEGFQMSHDEYLKGNLSLTIIEADFNKRNWYTCKCDGEVICDVSLRLEPFNYPLSVRVGESLTLDLPIPDDVEVTIKTSGSNPFRLCTVEGRKAQCESKYEKRVSVSSSLRLKEVKNDDGGIYTIRDIKNDEVIGTYAVTVDERKPDGSDDHDVKGGGSVGVVIGVVVTVVLLVIIGIGLFVWKKKRKCGFQSVSVCR